MEYEFPTVLDSSLHNNEVPCAACKVSGRGQQLMIPGKRSCPQNWTKEYEGVLVSQRHDYKKSNFICVDKDAEGLSGGEVNDDGNLIYAVQVVCGALQCPPYSTGKEIACVVCSI